MELVNTSLEKYLLSQVPTNKLLHEISRVRNSQRNGCGKPLTSASGSAKTPNATSAAEKMHLLPITTSDTSCSAQVPLETKCPGPKSSADELVRYLLGDNQKVKNYY